MANNVIYEGSFCRIEQLSQKSCRKSLRDIHRDNFELVQRFRHEQELTSLICHDNSVRFLSKENDYSFCTEYLNGITLADLINYYSYWGFKIPAEIIIHVVLSVTKLFSYYERLSFGGQCINFVHRDMCPNNIILTKSGAVKVIDYGIARSSRLSLDEDDLIVGSFPYIAPEQLQCSEVDNKTDIYSLGLILYEMLTLSTPLTRNKFDIYQLQYLHHKKLPLKLNGSYPKEFSMLIEGTTQFSRKNRISSVEIESLLSDFSAKERIETSRRNLRYHLRLHFPEIYNTIFINAGNSPKQF